MEATALKKLKQELCVMFLMLIKTWQLNLVPVEEKVNWHVYYFTFPNTRHMKYKVDLMMLTYLIKKQTHFNTNTNNQYNFNKCKRNTLIIIVIIKRV